MKTLIHLLLTFLFILPNLNAQEQHTFSSKENIFTNWIKQDGQTAYNWNNDLHRVGELYQTYWYEIRNFDCWQWTYSEMPTEATVTSVTIKFRANKGNYSDSFTFSLHNIPYILNTPNVNFFNESNSNQIYLSSALTPDANHNVFFNQTFTSQSPVGGGWEIWNAVNNAVRSGNYFLTLGIRERVSLLLPYWNIAGYDLSVTSGQPCVDLIINFTTPDNYYTFKNKIQTLENYGSLILNNDIQNPLPSGSSPVFLPWGSQNSVRTNVLPFVVNWNSTGTTQKHNYWDLQTSSVDYSLHHNFEAISSSPSELKATFLPTSITTIKNNLLEIPTINAGNVGFIDPWLYYQDEGGQWFQLNEPHSYISPFSILNNAGSYGGVFLNQTPDENNPNKPYYSVKEDQYQDILIPSSGNTYRFYFQNWTGTGGVTFENQQEAQTGVVFTSNGSVATANLKGQLISNESNGFSGNGQRKIVRDNSGYYHSVYSSLTQVWYTKSSSTDFADNWIQDSEIFSDISSGSKNPSVDVNGNDLAVIAELQDGSSAAIYLYRNDSSPLFEVALMDNSLYGSSYPVIAKTNNELFIVYKTSATSTLKYRRYYQNNSYPYTW